MLILLVSVMKRKSLSTMYIHRSNWQVEDKSKRGTGELPSLWSMHCQEFKIKKSKLNKIKKKEKKDMTATLV